MEQKKATAKTSELSDKICQMVEQLLFGLMLRLSAIGGLITDKIRPTGKRGNPLTSLKNILSLFQRRHNITPACAGRTSALPETAKVRWDHPRSRGDNYPSGISTAMPVGSPPLTRGQPLDESSSDGSSRITPAHAGTTIENVMLEYIE